MAFELIKVSELPELTTPSDPNVIPIQDGDYLKRISFENLKEAVTDDVADDLAAEVTAREGAVSDEATARGNADTAILADLASPYSASATYAVGDYCTKDGQLYRCTTAITTAEAWTSGHWSAVALGDDTRDLRSALNAVLDYNGINNSFDGYYYNGYWSSSGVLTPAANADVCCATMILCPENANVVLKTTTEFTGYAIYISYFDEAGTTRIRRDVASSALYEGVSPEGTHYFAFTYEKSGINKDNFGTSEVYINNAIAKLNNDLESTNDFIESVRDGNINDGAISIPKTDFMAIQIGNNLYDNNTNTTGVMYGASGTNVTEISNQYTSGYTAVCVLLPEGENVSAITLSSTNNYVYLYNYFTSESVSVPAIYTSTATPKVYIQSGYTISIPSGTKAVFMSFQNLADNKVMINAGSSAMPYEPYTKKYLLDGNAIAFTEDDVKFLQLPEQYHAVVGDTFELFYKGIANVVDSDEMEFDLTADKGKGFEKRYVVTPSATGTSIISVSLKDNKGKEVEAKTFNLISVAAPSSPASQKNILCIGDSLTQDGVWCAELNRRLTGTGGTPTGNALTNISFIGTCINGSTGYEAYGGWSINSYLSSMTSNAYMLINGTFDKTADDQHSVYKDSNNKQWKLETISSSQIKIIRVSDSGTLPSSGTLTWVSGGTHTGNIVYTSSEQAAGNPFWNSNTNSVDFETYATNLGVSSIDYAVIFLGWNSVWETESNYKGKVTEFIGKIRDAFPSCTVVLIGLQVPSRNGLANNYGTTEKYYSSMQNVWKMNGWYSDLADTLTDVHYVSLAGQFDTEHGYPTITMNVNTRSTITEVIQSNGVHPNESGKFQIADAVYREMCALLGS